MIMMMTLKKKEKGMKIITLQHKIQIDGHKPP